MSCATIKIICIQSLMAVFMLVAFSASTPAQDGADARALERLKWMRQNEGNLWNVNADEGAFLRSLAEKVHAREALEIGTSNGYSSIWIGMGLRREDGHLVTLEIDEGRAKLARANFKAAGLDSIITLKLGDALVEIPKLHGPYDFVFIDAWKQDYVKYLNMVIPLVRPGGVIVAHNVTDLKDELTDFIHAVQTNPQLKTDIENPGPGGFSVSYKLPIHH
ncbi:MAG: O-methyltransferase [Terriglobia bacterium]|jgi:predicted O-methyltransferase YrrM